MDKEIAMEKQDQTSKCSSEDSLGPSSVTTLNNNKKSNKVIFSEEDLEY